MIEISSGFCSKEILQKKFKKLLAIFRKGNIALDPFVLPRRGFLRISERVRQLLALQKDVTLPHIQRLGGNYGRGLTNI